MKTKLVLWANQSTEGQPEEKVLVALELNPEANIVSTWVFAGEAATEEFAQQLMGAWRKGEAVAFPESATKTQQELSASAELLPSSLRPERDDLVKRTQTEWLFIVLSTKLYQTYQSELADLQEQVNKLEYYDKSMWDTMKSFWDKVQAQITEQNLFRDHSDLLRTRTNEIFGQMKQLRSVEDAAFEQEAKQNYDAMTARLEAVLTELETASDTYKLFETLKEVQKDFKTIKLTRQLRTDLWNRIDDAFKAVKGKRYTGSYVAQGANNPAANAAAGGNSENRLSRRIDGLRQAVAKMEESISRDEKELGFQTQKLTGGNTSQLETQLREVRAKLIQERIDSKKVKLDDMKKTLTELETRPHKGHHEDADSVASAIEEDGDDSDIQTL